MPSNGLTNAVVIPEDLWARHSLIKEFLREQLPLVALTFAAAVGVSLIQFGFVPDGDRPFAIAGVRVPIWHLVWLGFWTGYTMGVVGEASGIFALPYSISVLQFTGVAVSPTILVVTLLNPLGALLGYWRGRQFNFDLAAWLCLGAVLGAPIGPFIRVYWLANPEPFKVAVGFALAIMAIHMMVQLTSRYARKRPQIRAFDEKFDQHMAKNMKAGLPPSGLPSDFRIITLARSWRHIRIGYWGAEQTFNPWILLVIGCLVGIVASSLGVGGGFLLVPIMASVFGVPMYVLVAASIPFVITISVVGLFTYAVTLPLLSHATASPDWSFGLFVASGAIVGAWVAAKTQRFIPQRYLKVMLSIVTGIVGTLYLINYFWTLPFKI